MSKQTSSRKTPQALDFKSATLYAIRVVLHDPDTSVLIDALAKRMHDAGAFFENEPVVIDAERLDTVIDWPALLDALRSHQLHPVGVIAEGAQQEAALAAGLPAVDVGGAPVRRASAPVAEQDMPAGAITPENASGAQTATAAQPDPPVAEAAPASAEIAGSSSPPPAAPAAMIINRPLRSGQRIYARDTDLIIIGVVSRGAEVIADGNVHVYGPLRGKAMAGARGDASARIFTTQLDPELVAIAGVYRVIETTLDAAVQNKPAIVSLSGESLQFESLGN